MSAPTNRAAADFATLVEPALAAGSACAAEVLERGGDFNEASIAGNLAAVTCLCKALHRRIFDVEELLTEPAPSAPAPASSDVAPGAAQAE